MFKFSENIIDKFSIDFLRNQVLKNAYGNDDTKVSKLDPRTLIIWYMFFGIIPWFLNNLFILSSLFIFVVITTKISKIAPLVIFLFCLGIFSQTGYLLIVSIFFGGDTSNIIPILILTLKTSIVSLASITVFSGLDPDKLADGLLYFKIPDQFSFSLSFAYRILPLIMEEFQNILTSYRLRGIVPDKKGFIGKIKYIIYQIKIIILSFYPLILNAAKRSRTTVEALELKGYNYSLKNNSIKKLKLEKLKFTKLDITFAIVSIIYLCIIFTINVFL
jgi:energy-coupling factor transport system permease protein